MVEPKVDVARRTRMIPRLIVAALLICAVLAGCGNAGEGTVEGSGQPPRSTSAIVGDCAPNSPAVKTAKALGAFDLDGDGMQEQLSVTAAKGSCPKVLFAKVGGAWVSRPLGEVSLDPSQVRGIRLPGHDGEVILAKQFHPRGGFAVHLYGYDGNSLAELLVGGHQIFEFLATDTRSTLPSASCTSSGFQVTSAVPRTTSTHDVSRTTYTVSGNAVTAGITKRIATNITDVQLRRQYPELGRYAMFENC